MWCQEVARSSCGSWVLKEKDQLVSQQSALSCIQVLIRQITIQDFKILLKGYWYLNHPFNKFSPVFGVIFTIRIDLAGIEGLRKLLRNIRDHAMFWRAKERKEIGRRLIPAQLEGDLGESRGDSPDSSWNDDRGWLRMGCSTFLQ